MHPPARTALILLYAFWTIGALGHKALAALSSDATIPLTGPTAVWAERAYECWIGTTFLLLLWASGKGLARVVRLDRPTSPPPSALGAMVAHFILGCYWTSLLLLALALTIGFEWGASGAYILATLFLSVVGLHEAGRNRARLPAVAETPAVSAPEDPERGQATTNSPREDNPLSTGWLLRASIRLWHAHRPGWLPTAAMLAVIAAVIATGAVFWASPYVLRGLLPNAEWDTAAYHLPVAKRFAAGEVWATDPYFTEYNYPGALHLLYMVPLRFGGEPAVLWFNFLLMGATVLAVAALACELWGRAAGVWAASILASLNLFWEVSIGARVDLFLSLVIVAATHAFLVWMRDPARHATLVVAGAALGLAVGTKYTALPFVAMFGLLSVLLILARRRGADGWRAVMLLSVVVAALLLTPSLTWYARNWIQLDNPIYPIGSRQMARADDGGMLDMRLVLDRLLDRQPLPYQYERMAQREPSVEVPESLFNIWDVLRHPQKYTRQPRHTITPFVLAFLLLPLVRRDRVAFALWGVALAAYVAVGSQSYLLRYVMPCLALACVGAGAVFARWCRWWPIAVVLVGWLGWSLMASSKVQWVHLNRTKAWAYLATEDSAREWLARVGYNADKSVLPVIDLLNAGSREAKVFMVGESRGNLLDVDYLPDGSRQGDRWLAELVKADGNHDQIARSLERQGVTHVLVNLGYFNWVSRHIPKDARAYLGLSLFHLEQFLDGYTEPVFDKPYLRLMRLKRTQPSEYQQP